MYLIIIYLSKIYTKYSIISKCKKNLNIVGGKKDGKKMANKKTNIS